MQGEGEGARLFVALDLPDEIRDELARWRGAVLRDVPGLRPVSPQSLHVTLCFLGWRPVDDVADIARACATAVAAARADWPPLAIARGLWLPARRPRVLAVELEDRGAETQALQARLSDALEAGGWFTREKRPFLPHVTVARVRRGVRVQPSQLPPAPSTGFAPAAVTLYRSRLEPGGASYEVLSQVPLAPAGGAR